MAEDIDSQSKMKLESLRKSFPTSSMVSRNLRFVRPEIGLERKIPTPPSHFSSFPIHHHCSISAKTKDVDSPRSIPSSQVWRCRTEQSAAVQF